MIAPNFLRHHVEGVSSSAANSPSMHKWIAGCLLGLTLFATGCSSSAPKPEAAATPAPAATSAAPELAAETVAPPKTRDPFTKDVKRPHLPATQPMQRVGVDYQKTKRDPFGGIPGVQRGDTWANETNEDQVLRGEHIRKPSRPNLTVVKIEGSQATLRSGGETIVVREGQFVKGVRVQSISGGSVTVTNASVPFVLR